MTIYDYKATKINGEEISLDIYKNKVVLIVNTATNCGLAPQFEELQQLYIELKDSGFEILGFPSNQFQNQEPRSNEEIKEHCKINYGVTFTMFNKIDVNKENEHPLFTYLKQNTKSFLNKDIKWNFTKFLVDKEGNVVKRYSPTTKPINIKSDIIKLINKA